MITIIWLDKKGKQHTIKTDLCINNAIDKYKIPALYIIDIR